jgi:hypothetical protein
MDHDCQPTALIFGEGRARTGKQETGKQEL